MTFWQQWHQQYDDPTSSLSRRLQVVQDQVRRALADADRTVTDRPLRLISFCAGDGRDVLEVLAEAGTQVQALLVDNDPGLTAAAAQRAEQLGLSDVTVREADAGIGSSFADHVPADICLICGVLGNISTADTQRLIEGLRSMITAGATVIWTRGHHRVGPGEESGDDPSETIRQLFAEAGYQELDFIRPVEDGYRVGRQRYTGDRAEFQPDVRLFSFVRHDDSAVR